MYRYFPFFLNVWKFTFPNPRKPELFDILQMWDVECGVEQNNREVDISTFWSSDLGCLALSKSKTKSKGRGGGGNLDKVRGCSRGCRAGWHQLWCSRKCTTTNSSTSRRRRRRRWRRSRRWRRMRRRWRRRAAASRTSTREPRPGLPGTSSGSITSLMPSPSPQAGAYGKCHTVRAQLKVILVRDPARANLSTKTKYYHISWIRCILKIKYQNHTTNIKGILNI